MKKLLLIITLSFLFVGLHAQSNVYKYVMRFLGGQYVGDYTVSGSNVMKQDSTCLIDGYMYTFNGVDTIPPGILAADQVQFSEVSIPKDPDVSTKTADYTLVLTDEFDFIYMNLGTADTVFVPLNASVAFPLNTQITIINLQAGLTTISPISGVTINSVGDVYNIKVKGMVTLLKYSADVWMLTGAVE